MKRLDVPDIVVLMPNQDDFYRLQCECGSRKYMIVQNGLMLKGNTQIMSIQCTECGDVQCFHPEARDIDEDFN